MNSFIKFATDKILLVPNKSDRSALAAAFKESIRLDFISEAPSPASAQDLQDLFRITLQEMHEYAVILDKNSAAEFLHSLGLEIPETIAKQLLNRNSYTQYFRRRPVQIRNGLVFTYAEIQHLFGYGRRVDLPDSIEKFINKNPLRPDESVRLQGRELPLVFLCHANEDKAKVEELRSLLIRDGFYAWLDSVDLLPGIQWESEISRIIKNADFVLVCISKRSTAKTSFVQKEIRFALDRALEMPPGRIFIIPCRVEECHVPEELAQWHWVDLFDQGGYSHLLRSLHSRIRLT
jgi:hypothetical protein